MWLSTIRRSAHWIAVTCETAMPMTTRMSRRRERREVAQVAMASVHDAAAATTSRVPAFATARQEPRGRDRFAKCRSRCELGRARRRKRQIAGAGSLYSCAGTDERRAAAASTASAAATATATGRSGKKAGLRKKEVYTRSRRRGERRPRRGDQGGVHREAPATAVGDPHPAARRGDRPAVRRGVAGRAHRRRLRLRPDAHVRGGGRRRPARGRGCAAATRRARRCAGCTRRACGWRS